MVYHAVDQQLLFRYITLADTFVERNLDFFLHIHGSVVGFRVLLKSALTECTTCSSSYLYHYQGVLVALSYPVEFLTSSCATEHFVKAQGYTQ